MSRQADRFHPIRGDVSWLTSKGVDLARYPIDDVLKKAVSGDEESCRSTLTLLRAMHLAGRVEAGVFLLGLLAYSGDNWLIRTAIVEALEGFNTPGCAGFMFSELRRVKSNNTTRRYLSAVLKVLQGMPLELTQSDLLSLAADRSFSQAMRDRFVEALSEASHR